MANPPNIAICAATCFYMDFGDSDGGMQIDRTQILADLVDTSVTPTLTIDGPDSDCFSLVGSSHITPLTTSDVPGRFTVQFVSNRNGLHMARLQITVSGDPNSPYQIAMWGTGSGF